MNLPLWPSSGKFREVHSSYRMSAGGHIPQGLHGVIVQAHGGGQEASFPHAAAPGSDWARWGLTPATPAKLSLAHQGGGASAMGSAERWAFLLKLPLSLKHSGFPDASVCCWGLSVFKLTPAKFSKPSRGFCGHALGAKGNKTQSPPLQSARCPVRTQAWA